MNDPAPRGQASFLPWKGRSPTSAEFSTLLNCLGSAALVIDARSDSILAANSDFLRLTAYSLADLQKLSVSVLFPSLSRYFFYQPDEHHTSLTRRSGDRIQVLARGVALDSRSSRILVTVLPYDNQVRLKNDAEKQNQASELFARLAAQVAAPDLRDALTQILRLSSGWISARVQCIYQVDNRLNQLVKSCTTESETPVFPEITALLPEGDESVDMWVPGRRVTNEFFRTARVANLPYVTVFPLALNQTILGILLLSDLENQPEPDLEQKGRIIARGLEAALFHFAVIENLQETLSHQGRALSTRDTAIENAEEGIILIRPDLTIEEMNPAAEMMLGYATREVAGVPVENIIIGTDALFTALQDAKKGVPLHNLGNVTIHRRDGQPFLGNLRTYPVKPDQELHSILLFIRDENKNEQIRVKTQQLEQRALLGELMAIMAHEVRNPVNNISTGLQLLAMTLNQEAQQQDIIQRIQQDCGRLTHLVESTLLFSKTLEYKLAPCDLAGLFRRMLDRYRPRFTKANIQAYLQVDPDSGKAIGDLRALEQVFTNLINNSIAAMGNGGVLAIKMARGRVPTPTPTVEITVSDTGPGIPEEIRDHIFEPFVTNNPQGTGLGLAITKRIVTAHKGTIQVNSFPGGTVFLVSLPADTTQEVPF